MTGQAEFNPYERRRAANVASQVATPSGRVTQDDILAFLARQLISILLVTAVCVLVTFAMVTTSDPAYRANAQVLVERNRSPSLRTDIMPDAQLMDVINTEAILAKSPPVIHATITALGLDQADDLPAGGLKGLFTALGLATDLPPREAWVERLNRRLTVRAIPDTNVLSLSYPDKNPERSAAVINAVLDAYFAERLRVFKGSGEASVYNAEATDAEAEIAALTRQLDAIGAGGMIAGVEQRQTGLATESAQLNAQRIEAMRRKAELSLRYYDDHPEMVRLTSDIATIDQRLGQIRGEIAGMDARMRQADQVRVQLRAAEQKYLAARTELDQAALRETADTALTNVRLIHDAQTPSKPTVSPLRALVLSVPLGLILGLAIAFLREYFRAPRQA